MDYSSFMSSGLLAIAPRHTHRRSHSATNTTTTTTTTPVRPLPLPPAPTHRMGHTRATSLPFRIGSFKRSTNALASESQPRVHFERDVGDVRNGEGSGIKGARTNGSQHSTTASDDDEPSSYLSLDDSDSDSDSLPDEMEDDIHATFIDLNESNTSLLLPQLVLPDSPHEQPDPFKVPRNRNSTALNSFLSFTPTCSPVDSPIISMPSELFLQQPEPAVEEGTSRHLDSQENEFEKGLQLHTETEDKGQRERGPASDWREAVDNFIGEGSDTPAS